VRLRLVLGLLCRPESTRPLLVHLRTRCHAVYSRVSIYAQPQAPCEHIPMAMNRSLLGLTMLTTRSVYLKISTII
jgi:hypothetical protein